MRVGDLVHRSWPSNPGRVGLLISQLPKNFTYGRQTGDFFDGDRDTIRSQFLKVVK